MSPSILLREYLAHTLYDVVFLVCVVCVCPLARTAVTVCMESIRKLMEEQTLDEEKLTSSAAISRIPEGTRLAFCNYNGAWSQEHPEIADKIVLKPMFERDDADHGEFHLFYKRVSIIFSICKFKNCSRF